MPKVSHQVLGIVSDADGNILEGATVLLTHVSSEETLTLLTNDAGEFIFNLKSITTWAVGDNIKIKASKTKFGQKTVTFNVTSGPADRQDITLAYTSDLIFDTGNDQVKTNAAVLVDFEVNPITPANRLPITDENALAKYRASDTRIDGSIRYYGFLAKDGSWYIRRDDLSDKTNRKSRYTKGTSNYSTNLTNRASLDYDFFNEVF